MNRNSIFLICFIIFYLILFNILNYVKIKIKSLKGITMTNKLNKLDIVEKHYKRKPIIYTYISFYEDYLYPTFKQYPLWIANYNNVSVPTSVFSWQLWQFTENGITAGAKVKIDFNIFNGDSSELNKLLL